MIKLSTALIVFGLVVSAANTATPDQHVPADQLSRCPRLKPRKSPPRDAKDVYVDVDSLHAPLVDAESVSRAMTEDRRPDDIKIIMALGDSITAGLLAKGERKLPGFPFFALEEADNPQLPFTTNDRPSNGATRLLGSGWKEYRGVSYPTGADPEAVTLHNIFQHYSPFLRGGSTGSHGGVSCLGPICGHPVEDALNAAISGSTASNLALQVEDYLLPTLEEMRVDEGDWKFVNIGIGGNDICAFCLAPNTSIPLTGTPKQFAGDIKRAVEHLRKRVPNLIVNIVGSLRVSTLYELTKQDPYCSNPIRTPITPRLPLECSCALLPGPAGDYTRQKMDDLGQAYDEAVVEIIRAWEAEDDPTFGVLWQPGSIVDLANWPIQALSPVDCFHPSEATHARVAAGIWNRLTRHLEERARPIAWEETISLRCMREEDRFPIGRAFE